MVVPDLVMRLDRRNEVARNDLRPLVDQLVERVLTVSPWLTPNLALRQKIDFWQVTKKKRERERKVDM